MWPAGSNLRLWFAKVYRFFDSHRPLQAVLNLNSHTQFIGTELQWSCCVTLNFLRPGVFSLVSLRHPCLGRKANFRFRISTRSRPPLKLDELRWGISLEDLFPQALIQSLRYFLLSWRFTTGGANMIVEEQISARQQRARKAIQTIL